MKSLEQHMTMKQAAAKLAVSYWTVRRLVIKGKATNGRDGIHPTVRIGDIVLIPESSLCRFLERQMKWS